MTIASLFLPQNCTHVFQMPSIFKDTKQALSRHLLLTLGEAGRRVLLVHLALISHLKLNLYLTK